jgi:DNA-binding response OmpR family regulator
MAEVILVVDDNPLLLAMIGAALRSPTTVPVLADGASAAMHDLDQGIAPDAVVIDLDMRDGTVVLSRVLSSSPGGEVPVVALSSRPGRLLEAGMADVVLVKPFELSDLRACVRDACGRQRGAS